MAGEYDTDWHLRHREKNIRSATTVAELLTAHLPIRSVVDFGCGDGVWLKAFEERGASTILGLDGSWTRREDLVIDAESFREVDLTAPQPAARRYDLAICLEVAEHLPPAASTTLVESICGHSDVVLFGAAIPGQGGYRHVNERWQSYWTRHFADRHYRRFDFVRPRIWNDPHVHFWYKQNVAVFVSGMREDLLARLTDAVGATALSVMPEDVVHPDLFDAIASYRQIAFKKLLPNLLPRSIDKARAIVRQLVRR